MENEQLFDDEDLKIIKNFNEFYISLDVNNGEEGINKNFFTNTSVKINSFPNTLYQIGKKYSCLNKIIKYINNKNNTFTYKIKLDKNSLFEMSISVKLL